MYDVVRPLLFALSPETAHELTMSALRLASNSQAVVRGMHRAFGVEDPRLAVSAFGLQFPNPIGLAAGLDKDGVAIPALSALGFGSLEVGSVTAVAQAGNPRPRLFRLPRDEALVNRMGFNNQGAGRLAQRLAQLRALPAGDRRRPAVPIGVNVGKSRAASAADAERDYRVALRAVWSVADYVVFNVSSPNTPGLRDLQEREPLVRLLSVSRELSQELGPLPVLVKLSPDLSHDQLRVVAEVAQGSGAAGLIATNTTVTRPGLSDARGAETGGLSGRPLAALALAALRDLTSITTLPVVSVGGIFTAGDVLERLRAGAVLVQLYTSFVYGGPALVSSIKGGIRASLDATGSPDLASLVAVSGRSRTR